MYSRLISASHYISRTISPMSPVVGTGQFQFVPSDSTHKPV